MDGAKTIEDSIKEKNKKRQRLSRERRRETNPEEFVTQQTKLRQERRNRETLEQKESVNAKQRERQRDSQSKRQRTAAQIQRRDNRSQEQVDDDNIKQRERRQRQQIEANDTKNTTIGAVSVTEDELKTILEDDSWDSTFQSDVRLSLLLFHLNSGHYRFDQWKEFSAKHEDSPLDMESLKKEIKAEKVSPEDSEKLVREFFNHHSYAEENLYSCGACGWRQMEKTGTSDDTLGSKKQKQLKYAKMFLDSDQGALYRLSDAEADAYKTKRKSGPIQVPPSPEEEEGVSVCPWKILSVTTLNDENGNEVHYHLHPELVCTEHTSVGTTRYFTLLCPNCNKASKKKLKKPDTPMPEVSLAAGVDFGYFRREPLLPDLTLHEKIILAKCRLYFASVKLSSNTKGRVNFDAKSPIKGHAILFLDDSVTTVSDHFDKEWLKESMHIHCLDAKGKTDSKMMKMLNTAVLLARPWVLYRWLVVLKHVHPLYGDIQLPSFEELSSNINSANTAIQDGAYHITDETSLSYEQMIGSDIAQAQYREISTPMHTVEEANDSSKTAVDNKSKQFLPLRTSCVVDAPGVGKRNNATIGDMCRQSALGFISKHIHELEEKNPHKSAQNSGHSEDMVAEPENNADSQADFDALFTEYQLPTEQTIETTCESEPINEIEEDGDKILSMAFPHVFMTGKAYGKRSPGTLKKTLKNHLYHQFSMVPEKEEMLIAYMRSAAQRFEVNQGVKTFVANNPKAVGAFSELLKSPTLATEFAEASKNTDSKKARAFIRKYSPYIRFSGTGVGYGAVECYGLKSQVFEMCKRFGLPSSFLTMSFGDIDNPRAYRASFHTVDNNRFPAVFEKDCPYGNSAVEFMSFLRGVSTNVSEGDLPNSSGDPSSEWSRRADRARAAMDNPIAYVEESKKMIFDVLNVLLGRPPEKFAGEWEGSSSRKTTYFMKIKGVLGHTVAYIGVVEDHQKGTLHYHILFFGGLPPYALQKFAKNQDLVDEISKVLDSTYRSQLREDVLVPKIISDICHQNEFKLGAKQMLSVHGGTDDLTTITPRIPLLENQVFFFSYLDDSSSTKVTDKKHGWILQAVDIQAAKQMWHRHMATCRKGLLGISGCRLAMPAGCVSSTRPVELWLCSDDLEDEKEVFDPSIFDSTEDTPTDLPRESRSEIAAQPQSRFEPKDVPEDICCEHGDLNFDNVKMTTYQTGEVRYQKFDPPPRYKDESVGPYRTGVNNTKGGFQCDENTKVAVWESARPIPNVVRELEFHAPTEPDSSSDMEDDDDLHSSSESCGVDSSHTKQIQTLKSLLDKVEGFGKNAIFWSWLEKLEVNKQSLFFERLIKALKSANGEIATFNQWILFATGSHANCQILGGIDQALGAVFYICPYIAKRKAPIEESLALLNECFKLAKKYGTSLQSEKNLPARFAMNVLQRTLNKMNLKMELSSFQIAAAELGLPSIITSETFAYRKPSADLAYINYCGQFRTLREAQKAIAQGKGKWVKPDEDNSPSADMFDQFYHGYNTEDNVDPVALSVNNSPSESGTADNIITDDVDSDDESEILQQPATKSPYTTTEQPVFINVGCIDEHYIPSNRITDDIMERYSVIDLSSDVTYDKNGTARKGIFIPRVEHYLHRGPHLRNLSRHEYASFVQILPRRNPKENARMKRMDFSSSYPLFGIKQQALRGKQHTVIINDKWPSNPGFEPPRDTEEYTLWKSKADRYASYILVEFRPEPYNYGDYKFAEQHPVGYTWGDLVQWIEHCMNSDCMIDKFRLSAVQRRVNGLGGSPYPVKHMLFSYRCRSRRLWTIREDAEHKRNTYLELLRNEEEKKDKKRGLEVPDDFEFDHKTNLNMKMHNKYDYATSFAFARHSRLSASSTEQVVGTGVATAVCDRNKMLGVLTPQSVSDATMLQQYTADAEEQLRINKRFKEYILKEDDIKQDADSTNQQKNDNNMDDDPIQQREAKIREARAGLNEKQAALFDHYVEHFRNPDGFKATKVLLIHGMGGAGKTEALKRLDLVAPLFNKRILKTAFNCINAVQFTDGQTTASIIDIRTPDSFEHGLSGKQAEVLSESLENVAMVAIDEVGNQANWHVSKLSNMLQLALGNKEPFGGLPVMMMGDFGQKGPVKAGDPIPKGVCNSLLLRHYHTRRPPNPKKRKSLMSRPNLSEKKFKPESPYLVGAAMMCGAKFVEMTDQMRSVDDEVHTGIVTDTYNCKPFQLKTFRENYKLLQPTDYKEDSLWYKAPVIVSTNRERLSLGHEQAVNFAVHSKSVVVRWKGLSKHWRQKPPVEYQETAIRNDPCFFDYFVPGMPTMFNGTVNKKLNIVNSLLVEQHSLVMKDGESAVMLMDRIAKSNPGDIITLDFMGPEPERPVAVVVKITLKQNSPGRLKRAYKKLLDEVTPEASGQDQTNGDRWFLLPVTHQTATRDWLDITVRGGKLYRPSKVVIKSYFPLDNGLAFTVEKVQGQTLDRAILSLSLTLGNLRHHTYSSIYVAISRVRHRNHLRLLLVGQTEQDQWDTLRYIEDLKPDPYMRAFLAGFRGAIVQNSDEIGEETPVWEKSQFNQDAVLQTLMKLDEGKHL